MGGQQDRGRDGEPGQLVRSEVTHDGRVGQDVERFGDQRAERRNRQSEDRPVVTGSTEHGEAQPSSEATRRWMPASALR